MNRAVPDYGPYDAPLLVVGEAGGKDEGRIGRPFVGVTGKKVRRIISACGLDPERDVRWANVIPVEMPTLPAPLDAVKALVRQHWNDLEPTLLRGTHKAVLCYGRAALWRLLARTKITDECGATYRFKMGAQEVPCVVSVHPAAVMRSKIEAGWTLVSAATERAVRYAKGQRFDEEAQRPPYDWVYAGAPIGYMHQWARANGWPVAIDCEFDPATNRPFLVGLSCTGRNVLSVVPNEETLPALSRLCADLNVRKVFHHAPADVAALAAASVHVVPPVYDTLMLYNLVYPDLPIGLNKVCQHLFDDWGNWKGMAHDDPQYNAIDVVGTWRAFEVLWAQAQREGLDVVWEREAQHLGPLCMAMNARGLAVDRAVQVKVIEAHEQSMVSLKDDVQGQVAELFARRRVPHERRLVEVANELAGIVQPRLKKDRDPTVNAHATALRKVRDRCRTLVARWTQGFDLGNNDHLRWLLYDKEGFGLTVQRHPVTKAPTANSDAIARLLALKKVQESPAIKGVLAGVKDYQHRKKMGNTFLAPTLDAQGFAHPEARPYGTGTGRLAGGADGDLGDKKTNAYAFNALNIPDEARSIYVPHPAVFKVDPALLGVLKDDDDDTDDVEVGDV